MNAVHYIETSALNLFADKLRDFEFNSFYQAAMKVDLCISPLVVWEVLLNADNSRKETLIHWAQFNCADYLLKSPTEIAIQYLKNNMPLRDRIYFHQNKCTSMKIGTIWSNIHRKPQMTILSDLEDLQERSKPLRDFSSSFKKIISSMTNENEHGNNSDYFHRLMVKLYDNLMMQAPSNQNKEALVKTALILVFLLVCVGIELDNTPVREYWKALSLDDPLDRLEYLIEKQPKFFIRGPLMEMALMMNSQLEMPGGINRGSIFDSLHSVYCYYAHNTVSNDPHFTLLMKHTNNEIYNNIVRADKYVAMMNEVRSRNLHA